MIGAPKRAPFRVVPRAPEILWDGECDAVVLEADAIGFASASEDDRLSWVNAFRRLLDGIDAPVQVIISAQPGRDHGEDAAAIMPTDFGDMRGADVAFADRIARSPSAHRFTTQLIASEAQASRLSGAFDEMGIGFTRRPVRKGAVFGRELPDRMLTARGFSRTWCVDRLPGTDLEPGWLYNLLPPGLDLTLSWHANPLPVAWVVHYLERQLIGMRASRLLEQSVGTSDPALAGALPNAEDLQRRLASSQDKAFHVAVYVTFSSSTPDDLERGSRRIESAARAILCDLQACRFRMRDGFLATLPGGPDRLRRLRVVDTSTLATFFPWHEADVQEPGGLVIGRNRTTGMPVLIDPFDHRRYANANIGVFGHSGAGKTYLLSTIALGALGGGTQVFIIDPEHEYGGLAAELGGVDVQLALGSGHALNVLDLRPSDRHD
ncbi:MAG TPA: DUF87 domain-containing protein, partial [Candidatus Micrarchaeaceae archaeon]|nr:DUF87 domain-containing protein [Candidatus Micrarchaeaceae archaeon]